jgi:dienelactone hydrolase
MIEQHIDIPTADGAMNAFIVYPEENAPFPVVLFYMDAPGKREELHDMARRLASVGSRAGWRPRLSRRSVRTVPSCARPPTSLHVRSTASKAKAWDGSAFSQVRKAASSVASRSSA